MEGMQFYCFSFVDNVMLCSHFDLQVDKQKWRRHEQLLITNQTITTDLIKLSLFDTGHVHSSPTNMLPMLKITVDIASCFAYCV